jgi:hypothetical protein
VFPHPTARALRHHTTNAAHVHANDVWCRIHGSRTG